MVQFRPGGNPIRAFARSLAEPDVLFHKKGLPDSLGDTSLEQMLDANLRLSSKAVIQTYRNARTPEGTNLLVIVDQFEELFRFRTEDTQATDDAAAFVRLLLESASQREYPIYVVLTMRSDFLGDCSHFEGLPEALNESQYLVPRMSRDQRRAAITGPAEVGGGVISPVLLTRLVNDVGDNPDQLSMLQHALNRTWALWVHEDGHGEISLDQYKKVGTMAHALDKHAEKAWAELKTEGERKVCERICRALTDKGTDSRGIRRPVRFDRLCAIARSEPSEALEVMAHFRKQSRSFLMPPEGENVNDSTVIDISHESLMRVWIRLKRWTEAEAESARQYRRIADRASAYPERSGLLQGVDLDAALKFELTEQPSQEWAELYGGGLQKSLQYLRDSETAHEEEEVAEEIENLWHNKWQPTIFALFALLFFAAIIADGEALLPHVSHDADRMTRILAAAVSIFRMTLAAIPFAAVYILVLRFGRGFFGKKMHASVLKRLRARREQQAMGASDLITYKPAGWFRRIVAFVIDTIVEIAFFTGCFFVIALIIGDTDNDIVGLFILMLIPLTIIALPALAIRFQRQATIGMMMIGIKLVRLDGKRVKFTSAALRQVTKLVLLPVQILWPLVLGALALFAPDKKIVKYRQWPHDVLMKTMVIDKRSDAVFQVQTPVPRTGEASSFVPIGNPQPE
jgi:uncharacterized RDD family membrane protein YckC